jgi:hypothetical protein
MKNLPQILSLCAVSAALLVSSGCVQDQYRTNPNARYTVPRSPYVGSTEWLTWVDNKVDTRYANGNRPEPGTQEWYAVVDHVVFSDHSRDYYRNAYRNQYSGSDYQGYARTQDGTTRRYNYAGGSGYKLGTLEWRRAVTNVILTGKVPPPPPRSDPWDTPLTTTSDR